MGNTTSKKKSKAPTPPAEGSLSGGNYSFAQSVGTQIQRETEATGVGRLPNKNNDKVMPDIKPKIKDFAFAYDGNEVLWCEWWTLYFYGGKDKVDGMLNYVFFKAANSVGFAYLYPAVVVPHIEQQYIESDTFNLSEWKASAIETDVSITKENRFYALDKEHNSFRVMGSSKDKDLSWDMTICRDPAIEPLMVSKNLPLANNQNITFVSPIPGGPCTGWIQIFGNKYDVSGLGEVEHIYGPLLLPVISWNLTHGYNQQETTSIYWLHVPFEKDGKDHSSGSLRFQHKETSHIWKAHEYQTMETYSKSKVYPIKTILQTDKNKEGTSCRVTWKTTSISASNASDASENHVHIKVRLTNKTGTSIFRLEGMAEFHRFGLQKLFNKVKESLSKGSE